MADWAEQYLNALKARDAVETANAHFYDHATRLQDQRAQLANARATSIGTTQYEPKTPAPAPSLFRVTSPPPRPESPSLGLIRQDLSKAQQERGELQTRLDSVTKEFEVLKLSSKKDTKRLIQLGASVQQLTTKLRDREEELKGKAKLIEDVQDENVTLNLQLNMAEENAKKLKQENKDLVDRWMVRKGKEADRMNEQSRFK